MLVVRGERVVLPTGERAASIVIEDGQITSVGEFHDVPAGADIVEARNLVVSPGLVDSHVHVNEPGRTDWEGFDTATRAAAAGGVTTIVDMPLNSTPATTTLEAFELKRRAAERRVFVDVAFWGGVVPGNEAHLNALADAGVRGFKCFLVPSGVDDFQSVDEAHLRRALPLLARLRLPLLVHAELPARLSRPATTAYSAYLASRPPESESDAIDLTGRLSREYEARVHIVHVSSAEGVDAIQRARASGAQISGETCPHYLTFCSDDVPEGATEFKCAPPIRQASHRAALWRSLEGGSLDLVATDHSPSPPAMKRAGNFVESWGGIASLELSLRAVWTAALAHARSARTIDLARWMSEAPAALAGLGTRKGRIARGFDADLVLWRDDADDVVDAAALQQRHKVTPYAGRRLRGLVQTTFLRGERVWDNNAVAGEPRGRLL
ncbi:MAG TPA: allantoinase AllB [Vicinamibacterales bacterium]